MASTSELQSKPRTQKTNKSSVSETGHNKNVANFSTAYQILEEMDTTLKPQLHSYRTTSSHHTTKRKKPIYKNAVSAREVAMAPLGKLITKALNYTKSIGISTANKENIAHLVIKIRGDQKHKKHPTQKPQKHTPFPPHK